MIDQHPQPESLHHPPTRGGFSLVELLIVVAMLAVLAAVVIPNTSTSLSTDLISAAEVVISELDYARNLAVTYGSTYELTFSSDGRQLLLTHSGTNSALDTLPASPFSAVNDDPTQRVLRIDQLNSMNGTVQIVGAVVEEASTDAVVEAIEFGPLGETTRSETTIVWLSGGSGRARRYLPIAINPVTGIATAGEVSKLRPNSLAASDDESENLQSKQLNSASASYLEEDADD